MPIRTIPAQAKQLLAEAGYPNGFDAGDLYPWPPYFSTGEAIISYLGAIGIRTRLRTMERAAFYAALGDEEAEGAVHVRQRGLRQRLVAHVGDGARATGPSRMADTPTWTICTGGRRTRRMPAKREAMLHQIQQTLHERTRFAPIYDYIWASGVGPRVENPALMLIDPYPWAAPLEEVRLKRP